MAASLALQANVCAQANHIPLGCSAWMRFPQAQHIVQLKVKQHGIGLDGLVCDSGTVLTRQRDYTARRPYNLRTLCVRLPLHITSSAGDH